MSHINTADFDWYDFESRYLSLEKKQNQKKYQKKTIIKKKKN